jgi:Fur family ferric uptake transcriptional regulator
MFVMAPINQTFNNIAKKLQFVVLFCHMNAESSALLQKVLRDNGYSLTKPRQIVCDLLWGKEPQSMRELSQLSRGLIDRTSLYRTLDLFEKLGLVRRIYIGWKYKVELSDVLTHHHHHLNCLGCGKVVAITEETAIERLILELGQRYGFTNPTHQLEVAGYCPACSQQRS